MTVRARRDARCDAALDLLLREGPIVIHRNQARNLTCDVSIVHAGHRVHQGTLRRLRRLGLVRRVETQDRIVWAARKGDHQ